MLRRVPVCLTVILLVATVAVSAPASLVIAPGTAADGDARPPIQTTPDGFTNTAFEVQVYENASARWTVRHSTPLSNETEREQFEAFAQRFTSEQTQTFADFQVRAERLTAFGTNATDRQMSAVAFSRDATVEELGPRGVIELSFVWTNFSRTDGDRVVVGDVFQGGMYINSDQRFVIARGGNLSFTTVDPSPDSMEVEGNLTGSDTVTWFGGSDGRQFADSRPRAVLTDPASAGNPGTGTNAGDTATQTPSGASTDGFGPVAFVIALLLLIGLGGSIAWYSGALPNLVDGSSDSGGAAAAQSESSETEPPSEPSVPDEELLSDEDRVLQLLEDNGGRMKQVNIVNETDWSKSKVSMLLSDMEEDGEISKLRVGRENIISIRGEEPDAVGSPFDDE